MQMILDIQKRILKVLIDHGFKPNKDVHVKTIIISDKPKVFHHIEFSKIKLQNYPTEKKTELFDQLEKAVKGKRYQKIYRMKNSKGITFTHDFGAYEEDHVNELREMGVHIK